MSKPAPLTAGSKGGSPVELNNGTEGYEHKVSDTGRLEPFASDSANPEGYHMPTKAVGGGEAQVRTVGPDEDEMSESPTTTKAADENEPNESEEKY